MANGKPVGRPKKVKKSTAKVCVDDAFFNDNVYQEPKEWTLVSAMNRVLEVADDVGLGVLTAQGAKESKCRDWCMAVELKDWKDVMLHVDGRLMGSKECLNTIVNEYDKVRLNIDNILASIRKDFSYRKVLKEGHDTMVADGKVDMSLCIREEDNLFPYVGVAYQSGKYSVWFSVQDGELTCFDVN